MFIVLRVKFSPEVTGEVVLGQGSGRGPGDPLTCGILV